MPRTLVAVLLDVTDAADHDAALQRVTQQLRRLRTTGLCGHRLLAAHVSPMDFSYRPTRRSLEGNGVLEIEGVATLADLMGDHELGHGVRCCVATVAPADTDEDDAAW